MHVNDFIQGAELREETDSRFRDQTDTKLWLIHGEQPLGSIQWSDYHGAISINFLDVKDAYRRNGIASYLVASLQDRYPGKTISWGGMLTSEGNCLYHSIPKVRDESKRERRLAFLKRLEQKRQTYIAEYVQLKDKQAHAPLSMEEQSVLDHHLKMLNPLHDRIERAGMVLSATPEFTEVIDTDAIYRGLAHYMLHHGQLLAMEPEMIRIKLGKKQPSAKANELLNSISKLGFVNPINSRELVLGNWMTKLELQVDENALWVKSIQAMEPGRGHGTQALSVLSALADIHQVKLVLHATPFGLETFAKALTKPKLEGWYQHYMGFEPIEEGDFDYKRAPLYENQGYVGYLQTSPDNYSWLDANEVTYRVDAGGTVAFHANAAAVSGMLELQADFQLSALATVPADIEPASLPVVGLQALSLLAEIHGEDNEALNRIIADRRQEWMPVKKQTRNDVYLPDTLHL